MHQQINLYQPVFRRQHKVFSAVTLVQILGAVLVLLLAILGHARWNLAALKATQATLQLQYDQLRAGMNTLNNDGASSDTGALDEEIERLAGAIDRRKQLLLQFDQLTVDNKGGYAAYFEALARRDLPGLWLTGVHFDEEGAIELRGMTLDPKLVPVYLQMLARQAEFRDQRFDSVILNRPSADQPAVEFILRNNQAMEVR